MCRDRLNADIEVNFDKWMKYVKDKEKDVIGNEIRTECNHLLVLCNWTQSSDSPLDSEQKATWAEYRQELRDVPEQQGFPYDVIWPTQP